MSIFLISATLISGHGRGRQLGFPTLNLKVDDARPENGVYAVRVRWDGQASDGVLHIGPRPTFHERDVSVEVHLVDFEGSLPASDALITVEVKARLRDIQAFASSEALKNQVARDIMKARSYF